MLIMHQMQSQGDQELDFDIFELCPGLLVEQEATSVESSSFGSEFVAMKQCCEYIHGLRYKLRMMGIPVSFSLRRSC